MSHEGISIIDRDRSTSNHTNLRVFKGSAQVFYSKGFGNDISADQHNNRTGSLLEKQVDRGGFAFTFLLNTQAYTILVLGHFIYDGNSTVSTSTGNDDHFFNANSRACLIK
ncbi:MAG TPA: hypothetical protein VIY29_09655, partial [Ktedonobacteraceae bacterium]